MQQKQTKVIWSNQYFCLHSLCEKLVIHLHKTVINGRKQSNGRYFTLLIDIDRLHKMIKPHIFIEIDILRYLSFTPQMSLNFLTMLNDDAPDKIITLDNIKHSLSIGLRSP